MVKKANASAKPKAGGRNLFSALKAFFTNERTCFITGLVLVMLTIYVVLALISFFFTGAADQSIVQNIPLNDLLANRGTVENWTGVRGAFLADLLMNRLFGVSSFVFLFFLGSVGARLMRLCRVSLLKRFLLSAALLIWGSVFFAFVFIKGYEDTFLYLGGLHGYFISEWLILNIGIPGTILVLLGSFMVIAVFMSPRTIPFLQSLFSFGWLKRKKKADPEVPEDVAPEPEEEEEEEERPEEVKVEKEEPESPEEEDLKVDDPLPSDDRTWEVEVRQAPSAPAPEVPETSNPGFTVEIPKDEDLISDESPAVVESSFEPEGDYDPKLDLSSFRNPTIDLLKKYDINDIVGYRPEKSWNYEIGGKLTLLDGKLTAEAAAFYIDCRDQQLTVFPDGTTTGRIMANAGKTRSAGFELSVSASPAKRLQLKASYGYTNAKFVEFDNGKENYSGKFIPYAPQNTIFAAANYAFRINNDFLRYISVGADIKGTVKIYWNESNSLHQDLYVLLNGSVRFSGEKYSLNLWIKNATSVQYSTFYFVSIEHEFLQRGKPAQFGATLRINI